MYLKHIPTGDIVQVIDLQDVVNPHSPTVRAKVHDSERTQQPENILKSELVFLSGETLPLCWMDGTFKASVAA